MGIEELFSKYLNENMTPDEFLIFRELATLEENRATLNRLFAQWIDREFPFLQQEEIDVEALYLRLAQKEQIPEAGRPMLPIRQISALPVVMQPSLVPLVARTSPNSRRRIIFFGLAAAAACLLVISGVFLLRQPSSKPPPPIAATKSRIIPAGNKATLTLSNGTRIILDDAANGDLAKQGNTKIVKLSGGQLAYQAGEPDAGVLFNTMTTPRGGYYQLVLPDGSKVLLDAASSVRYPTAFAGKERSVEVTGEAYFEIAPNARQPFLITSNGMTVEVLGTEFNLMAYPDEDAIRTTLVSGSVRVIRGTDRLQIRPGQQASWVRGAGAFSLSIPDMQQVLAWKRGEFRFQGLPISAIMRQIARWYDVDVEFRGPQPVNEFSGVIPRKKEVTELLAALELTDLVHFTIQKRKIIVESAGH
jgi:transmembrane sensor